MAKIYTDKFEPREKVNRLIKFDRGIETRPRGLFLLTPVAEDDRVSSDILRSSVSLGVCTFGSPLPLLLIKKFCKQDVQISTINTTRACSK